MTRSVEAKLPKRWESGRVVGGYSLHAARDPEKCKGGHRGPWRVVDCCEIAGDDRDIVECAECGEQKTSSCSFDEDMS